MKMTTRVAFENMKYHKSKNVSAGIAIILTTLLLLVIPTVGIGIIEIQYAAVNKLYPSWHALYRNVGEETAEKLAAHHDISRYGLRSDVGEMNLEDASAVMLYLDEEGLALYKLALADGGLPREENEIVISKGILRELGQQGEIGDSITIPYQIYRNGELDFTQEKVFRICGFFEDTEINDKQKAYTALVSETFLKKELTQEQITYRFLFQVEDNEIFTTDVLEERILHIAEQFAIPETDINVNEDYLWANYVDPLMLPVIAAIMIIIMLAGIITIYSIYYVSMNQRVQEFGCLKAIGATKAQMKQVMLKEGLWVALLAIPVGLLIGTAVSKVVFLKFFRFSGGENPFMDTVCRMVQNGEVRIYHWWIYLLAIAVTLCTVYLSLVRPMHMAAKISAIEALRCQGTRGKYKSSRKGYLYLTLSRLTVRSLAGNKKKSAVTVVSMAATGMFLMMVSTVLSCANPSESADSSIVGQYDISPIIEEYNKEHPERKWSQIQKDNPLDADIKKQIEDLNGVERVDIFTRIRVTGDIFEEGDYEAICGIPEEYARELEKGICEGKVTYEELKSGDKVIVDRSILYWHPEVKVGDKLNLTIHDGDETYEKQIEIAAIGEYGIGLTDYDFFIMAKEAADHLSKNNSTSHFHVYADKDYDASLEAKLNELVDASGRIRMRTWKEEYDEWKHALSMTSGACYAFLAILSVISVMNLINTMINSVHVRKKELGMMQAIGMSDGQLMKMLQMEGLFYTLATLIISVGLGSLAGYPLFLYAKWNGWFEIRTYHYPVTAAVIMSAALLLIQIILSLGIAASVRRDSLIERIRFSE